MQSDRLSEKNRKTHAHMSMYDKIHQNNAPLKAPSLRFYGRRITYERLYERISAFEKAFIRRGFSAGDVITLALPNIPVAVYIFYAANKLGITVCLVHPLEPLDRIAYFASKVGSKAVFMFDEITEKYYDRLDKLPCSAIFCSVSDNISAFEGFFYSAATHGRRKMISRLIRRTRKLRSRPCICCTLRDFLSSDKFFAASDFRSSDPAKCPKVLFPDASVVMNSGGTEGFPKTVLLSDDAFNRSADNIINAISDEKDPPIAGMLALLPMFHAFGLGVVFHLVLSHGYEAVLFPKYSPPSIARCIKKGRVRYLAGVPTVYKSLLNEKAFDCRNLGRLVAAFCGGDALDEKTRESFDAMVAKHNGSCRLYQGYGLTETAGVFCTNKAGHSRPGSVGTAIGKDYEVMILKDGKEAEPGETGEICLSSPSLMISYYDDIPSAQPVFFETGGKRYLKTGDIGKKDKDGYLYFCDRVKRMTKVSGVNVFPSQVEEALRISDYVSDAAVKAVPDDRKGNVTEAYIVLKPGADPEEARRDMDGICLHRLNKWSRPVRYYFLDKLPRTAIGKIDYKRLGG